MHASDNRPHVHPVSASWSNICCAVPSLDIFVMIFGHRLVCSMHAQLVYVILPLNALRNQEEHMTS